MVEIDFEIEHRPGAKHGNADAMTLKPCHKCVCKEDIAGMPYPDQQIDLGLAWTMLGLDVDAWSEDLLAEQQAKDPELATIYGWMLAALETESDDAPQWSEVEACDAATKDYWTHWSLLTLRYMVLYRKWIVDVCVEWRCRVPPIAGAD